MNAYLKSFGTSKLRLFGLGFDVTMIKIMEFCLKDRAWPSTSVMKKHIQELCPGPSKNGSHAYGLKSTIERYCKVRLLYELITIQSLH